MACLRIVLAWTLGVPLAMALGCGILGAWMFAGEYSARHFGWPEGAGFLAALALMFVAMGATFGIIECRDRC